MDLQSSAPRQGSGVGLVLSGITDAVLVAYGLWTIVSTLTATTGATTRTGLVPGAIACALLGVASVLGVRKRFAAYVRSAEELPGDTAVLAFDPRVRWALVVAVPLAMALWLATRSLVALWAFALAGYGLAMLIGLRRSAEPASAPSSDERARERKRLYWLHALALVCAVFTLLAIRPRTDDPFYLSMSLSVVDHAGEPLLATRTLHGPPSATLRSQPMFAPYKVHSFETLAGFIVYLTGVDVSVIVHFGLATLFGWLTPFAIARLMRALVGSRWLLATVATVSYLMIDGTAGRGYANQAFVRMFNGKAAMLSFAVPLILVHGLRLGAQATAPRVIMLALAQISAMGMSSTGIWLAPIMAVVATAAGTPSARALFKSVSLAVLSSLYVLAMGAWIFLQMPADKGIIAAEAPVAPVAHASGSQAAIGAANLAAVLPDVLGPERTAMALLAVFTLAWTIARRLTPFRLFAYLGVVLVAVLANPWLTGVVGRLVTGSITYERVFWVLPVPIAIGVAVAFGAEWLSLRMAPRAAVACACGLLALFYVASVERLVIGEGNRAWLSFPPKLKVWPESREVAERVCAIARQGTMVLASEAVSQQLVTIEGCGHPLLAQERWLVAPAADKARRLALQRYVSVYDDITLDRVPQFRDGLEHYGVSVIVMNAEGMRNRDVKVLLRAWGFKKTSVVARQHIWERATKTRPERS